MNCSAKNNTEELKITIEIIMVTMITIIIKDTIIKKMVIMNMGVLIMFMVNKEHLYGTRT